MEDLAQHNDQMPVYNIKAVSRLVGLLPVTLRAWERRYGLPNPKRGNQGYRLYSENDLRILHWLKSQMDTGLNIGRAVEYLHKLNETGQDPAGSRAEEAGTGESPADFNHPGNRLACPHAF